jgi:DNA-binding NarL/FixJ family response regulator
MKILVIDDHALVRSGLRQVLKGLNEQVEVLEAGHCQRAFELAAEHPDLDLVLLDWHLPGIDGLQALTTFGRIVPELPVVILSGMATAQIVRKALAHGAAGFVSKSGKSYELLDAIRQVLAGGVYAPADLIGQDTPGSQPQFTRRQQEVLNLLQKGLSNREISDTLCISDDTTKDHVVALLRGFGVKTRTQAILAASHMGYG